MKQLHKKFADRQVKELIKKYLNKENERKHIQQILCIGKSINNLQLKVHNATPHDIATLRIYQLTSSVSEIRFWCKDKLLDVKRIKNTDLKGVHF